MCCQQQLFEKMRSVLVDFFYARWSGQVAVMRLFWFDMLTVASALNLVLVFISLFMLAQRVDWPWVLAVHSLALPYNVFLVSAVWRHAMTPVWMSALSAMWLLVVVFI